MKKLGYLAIAYFLCRSMYIGISFTSLVMYSNQDAWISIVVATLLGIIPVFIFYKIASYKEELNIIEKINYLFPKLNKIIHTLLFICIIFICVFNFWNLNNLISSQFLNRTPPIIIGITFLIPIIFLIKQNNHVIARSSLILLFISFFFYILSILGLIDKIDFNNLKPILNNNIFKGSIAFLSYNILPLYLLLIFPNKDIKKSLISGYIISSLSLLVVTLFTITVIGINIIKIYQYPEFNILKFAFEGTNSYRLENILSIQWIIDIYILISIGIKYCKETIKIKNNYILPIIVLIISNFIFNNNTVANTLFIKYIPYILIFTFLLIPLLILIKIPIKKGLKKS